MNRTSPRDRSFRIKSGRDSDESGFRVFEGSPFPLKKFFKLLLVLLFGGSLLFVGCQKQERQKGLDDLSAIKNDFLQAIFNESNVEEGPFEIHYTFRTVFFSKEVVSLFGDMNVHDHLPHGWEKYEGKTFCKINGRFKEITLADLFSTPEQREFLRSYCEKDLKNQKCNYFDGADPIRKSLEQKDIRTFVIDDQFLMIIFQPYTVGGGGDGPFMVKIPYEHLKNRWNSTSALCLILDKVISSDEYISSWDIDEFFQNLQEAKSCLSAKRP